MQTRATSKSTTVDEAFQQLNVGTRIQVRAVRENGQAEYFSFVVGFVRGEFLLIKSPVLRNTPVVLPDGDIVEVRAFTGTTIFRFKATVVRTLLDPLYCMHVTYPTEVERSSLRSELRVKLTLPSTISYQDESGAMQETQGRIVNLSASGAAIEVNSSLAIDTHIQLVFTIPDGFGQSQIRTNAVVRSARARSTIATTGNSAAMCGVQFQGLDENSSMAIRLLTYGTMVLDREKIV
jgi:c-di-GMP-binding flagellar brake protein YcgR